MAKTKAESDPKSLFPTGTSDLRKPRLSYTRPKKMKSKMPKPIKTSVKAIPLKSMVAPRA